MKTLILFFAMAFTMNCRTVFKSEKLISQEKISEKIGKIENRYAFDYTIAESEKKIKIEIKKYKDSYKKEIFKDLYLLEKKAHKVQNSECLVLVPTRWNDEFYGRETIMNTESCKEYYLSRYTIGILFLAGIPSIFNDIFILPFRSIDEEIIKESEKEMLSSSEPILPLKESLVIHYNKKTYNIGDGIISIPFEVVFKDIISARKKEAETTLSIYNGENNKKIGSIAIAFKDLLQNSIFEKQYLGYKDKLKENSLKEKQESKQYCGKRFGQKNLASLEKLSSSGTNIDYLLYIENVKKICDEDGLCMNILIQCVENR